MTIATCHRGPKIVGVEMTLLVNASCSHPKAAHRQRQLVAGQRLSQADPKQISLAPNQWPQCGRSRDVFVNVARLRDITRGYHSREVVGAVRSEAPGKAPMRDLYARSATGGELPTKPT